MRKFGFVIFFLSFVLLLIGVFFDTSVATDSGDRVHNIGLMQLQTNFLMFGGLFFIGGILMIALFKQVPIAAKEEPMISKALVKGPDTGWACPKCHNAVYEHQNECSCGALFTSASQGGYKPISTK